MESREWPAHTHTYVHSKVTSSRKKGRAGLEDIAVCHLVLPAGNIQLHSLGRQTVMQPQAEEQSGHMSQVSVAWRPEAWSH